MKELIPDSAGTIKEFYKDLLGPSAKKVGSALGAITSIILSPMQKLEYYSAMQDATFAHNMKKFSEELEKADEQNIIPAPPELSVPILERLTYVKNEELSNAFIQLLLNASQDEKIEAAHPGFIRILDRLSADEAKIINYVSKTDGFPYIEVKAWPLRPPFSGPVMPILTGLEKSLTLDFPNNIPLYLNNLVSLGILAFSQFERGPLIAVVEELYKVEIQEFSAKHTSETIALNYNRHYIEPTHLGEAFIKACVKHD